MKARRLCAALVVLLALLPLGGCKLYGNSRANTESVACYELASELRFCLREGQTLVYDRKSAETHFIYYYQKAYYAQEINGASDAVKICKDDAYDRGLTNYSYADFYFSGDYCVMKFHRGYNNYKKDYDRYILCTMDGKTLGNIKINSWQENG